jgi:hypothetical protein
MSEGHNDNEAIEQGETSNPQEEVKPQPASYYYDDSTNYETYCEDDEDDPTSEDADG